MNKRAYAPSAPGRCSSTDSSGACERDCLIFSKLMGQYPVFAASYVDLSRPFSLLPTPLSLGACLPAQRSCRSFFSLSPTLRSVSVVMPSVTRLALFPKRMIRMNQNCSHFSTSRRRPSKLQLRTRRRHTVFSASAISQEAAFSFLEFSSSKYAWRTFSSLNFLQFLRVS